MTDRIDPAETSEIWKGLEELLENGQLKPTVFGCDYQGLDSVAPAMKALGERKVWGKAVIRLDSGYQKLHL